MTPFFEVIEPIANNLFKAVVRGGKRIRILSLLATFFVTLAIIFVVLSETIATHKSALRAVAGILGVIGGILILGIAGYQGAVTATEKEIVVQKVEERFRTHPNEPQVAWELARVKLESYLNRNLAQISWIFVLTLFVMVTGFVIIGYGTIQAYQSPEHFKPSIVVTLAGLIVEFLGATFLFVYKSTMEQARDYVNILERINAVGMSVQILDSIKSDDTGLSDKTRAEMALVLLSLHKFAKKEQDI
jgi:hypothetical protein